jgi:hypothetical protein
MEEIWFVLERVPVVKFTRAYRDKKIFSNRNRSPDYNDRLSKRSKMCVRFKQVCVDNAGIYGTG